LPIGSHNLKSGARYELGSHWPIDVWPGWSVRTIPGWLAASWLQRRGKVEKGLTG
jgi:hypothetical protein